MSYSVSAKRIELYINEKDNSIYMFEIVDFSNCKHHIKIKTYDLLNRIKNIKDKEKLFLTYYGEDIDISKQTYSYDDFTEITYTISDDHYMWIKIDSKLMEELFY